MGAVVDMLSTRGKRVTDRDRVGAASGGHHACLLPHNIPIGTTPTECVAGKPELWSTPGDS